MIPLPPGPELRSPRLSSRSKILLGIAGVLAAVVLWDIAVRDRPSLGSDAASRVPDPVGHGESPTRFAAAGIGGREALAGSLQERPLQDEPGCWLRVLEAGSLLGIEGAEVVATDGSGTERHLTTSDEGLCRLPWSGDWHLTVHSRDHVRRELVGSAGAGEHVVLLECAGAIEVEVHTESGAPVEGARLALVPPVASGASFDADWRAWLSAVPGSSKEAALALAACRQGGEPMLDALDSLSVPKALPLPGNRALSARLAEALPEDAWQAQTDGQGRARWTGLPPAPGYRVGWLGPGSASLHPKHEHEAYTFEDGRWALRGLEIQDVTATIEVHAGTTQKVAVTAFREASLYGWIDTEGAKLEAPSLVRLLHRSVRTASGAPDLALTRVESTAIPTIHGQFEFHGFQPGSKRLSALWTSTPGRIRFASLDLEVEAGKPVDVGVLRAQAGHDLSVRVALRDPSGAELSIAEVFAPGIVPEIALGIDTLAEPKRSPGAISEMFGVSFGETLILTGLPYGKAYLRARLVSDAPLRDPSGQCLVEPADLKVECSSPEVEELVFLVTRQVDQRLRILWDEPEPVPRFEAYWRSTLGGPVGRADLKPPRVRSGSPEYTVRLASGRYEILVHAHALEAPSSDAGWYWTGQLVVTDGEQVFEMRPRRGSALQGVARSADGSPLARQTLFLTLPAWCDGEDKTWVYRTRTDERGTYRVSSLPPGVEVLVSTGDQRVRTGPGGSEQIVDLLRSGERYGRASAR